MKSGVLMLMAAVVAFSPGYGQPRRAFHRFEVSGGANLLMPREEYHSGWGLGLGGVFNLSPRYGINLAYGVANLDEKTGDKSKTVTTMTASVELAFRREKYIQSFTSIGLGTATGEERTLFIFGAGIKVPFKERFLVRLEIRDYHSEFGIPFMEFPGGRVAFQGFGGSPYLELSIGVGVKLGKEETPQRRYPRQRRGEPFRH